jgi:restriction system protein
MSRRNREKSLPDELFRLLKLTPVWVGPALAGIAYTSLRWLARLLLAPKSGKPDVTAGFRIMLPTLAWVFTVVVLMAWAIAELSKRQNHQLLDSQDGAECISKLSWQEFERLVCEAYRRRGYVAEVVGSTTGDGGVDIELSGNGELLLVQCKHWKAYKVGVAPTRELLGVVVSRRVRKGILVTSGVFTQEAKEFARLNVQLELVKPNYGQ